MDPTTNPHDAASAFKCWRHVVASELSTTQSFLIKLCHLPGVDVPHAMADREYVFERPSDPQRVAKRSPKKFPAFHAGAFGALPMR